nr:hypothetical protein CFP56_64582 [Quercus suber]
MSRAVAVAGSKSVSVSASVGCLAMLLRASAAGAAAMVKPAAKKRRVRAKVVRKRRSRGGAGTGDSGAGVGVDGCVCARAPIYPARTPACTSCRTTPDLLCFSAHRRARHARLRRAWEVATSKPAAKKRRVRAKVVRKRRSRGGAGTGDSGAGVGVDDPLCPFACSLDQNENPFPNAELERSKESNSSPPDTTDSVS